MHALYHFTGLALQGSCWIALFLCSLRLSGKLPHTEFVRFLGFLLPLWCATSGAVFYLYGSEAFIAFYGHNPYESIVLVKNGQPVSGDFSYTIVSLTSVACLLPFPLLFCRLRTSFPAAFTISLVAWICLVPLAALG